MSKKEQVKLLLTELGAPERIQTSLCCLTLLALAQLRETTEWSLATNEWLRIHDLITFMDEAYNIKYAENSRETIRKQVIHPFRDAAYIEDNGKATNSPNYRYRLTEELLQIMQRLDTLTWKKRCAMFRIEHRSLKEKYEDRRRNKELPFIVNGKVLAFSPGKHNELQKDILEKFLPQFAKGAQCLYVGDCANKELVFDKEKLTALGVDLSQKGVGIHGKLPDVILYSPEKHWLYLIEAVTSVGPITPERRTLFEQMTVDVSAGVIYVTAFPDKRTFRLFVEHLAWDTEVWFSDEPLHMLHLNGDRFIGPR